MNWFINLMTRTKLMVGLGIIILLLIIIMGNAYQSISSMQISQKSLFEEEFATAVDLKDIRSNQNAIRANLLAMMEIADPASPEFMTHLTDIDKRKNESETKLEKLFERNRKDPVIYRKLEEFRTVRKDFVDTRDNQIIPYMREARVQDAKQLVLGIQLERDQKMRAIADELVK